MPQPSSYGLVAAPKEAPVPAPLVREATQFRSTWLTSSLRALRERQLLDPYFAHLPRSLHETVRASVAGTWLPIDVALAHYEACDSLKLPLSEQLAMGREVTRF